jgi:glycosyltransferase involved in cell wall biosynthesis
LRARHPRVAFTALFTESSHERAEQARYHAELEELVRRLELRDHVTLVRGYQPDALLDAQLGGSHVAVFPYAYPENLVFGVSGAARVAMSRGVPVVTSRANHFADIPTRKADSPEELAEAIDDLYRSPAAREGQLAVQRAYVTENTWERVAARHVAIFAAKAAG